ncbi:MAG: hypothetical protein JSS40_12615 [Proteobacteria bacterium]|nr:hypothetical protein [Pseudomonadota bacterium]
MNARLIIGGLMLAASTALFAQAQPAPTPPAGPQGGPRGHVRPCAQEADPAKCEAQRKELREKMRGQYKEAREACKGKAGADRGTCMSQQMCAKAADPAKCEAHAKERMEHRHQMREKGAAPAAPKG